MNLKKRYKLAGVKGQDETRCVEMMNKPTDWKSRWRTLEHEEVGCSTSSRGAKFDYCQGMRVLHSMYGLF
jgi:hypothetical protein